MSIGVSCASFPSIRDIDSRAKHVLLPLYIYPSAGAWNDVYSNITANPGKNFTIVVNPASGPGSSTYPVSDYVAGIAKLNSYSNTQVLGYVDTGYPQISTSTVNSQVAQYKKWASYSKADIHIDGIFFDDMDGTYTPQQYAYYQNISITTKITMGPGFQHVLFNPGAGVDSRYFALADEIIVFEDYYYSKFSIRRVVLRRAHFNIMKTTMTIFHSIPHSNTGTNHPSSSIISMALLLVSKPSSTISLAIIFKDCTSRRLVIMTLRALL